MRADCSGQTSLITRNPSKIEALFLYFYSHQIINTIQITPLTSARLYESVSYSKLFEALDLSCKCACFLSVLEYRAGKKLNDTDKAI